jgi:OmpA-OmpF porin, OOP family
MKSWLVLGCSFLCMMVGFSQTVSDTVVYAEGKIIKAETKEPVNAKIIYKSLPYGNRIGIINSSSTYSFPMFDQEKYAILVEAEGYSPVKHMLDPSQANNHKVLKDILLGGSDPAPPIHTVGHVMRLNNLIFEAGKSKISSQSFEELDVVVYMMKERESMVIQLEGHTDYLGDPHQNMKLSQERVDAVKDYLVSKGISKHRVKTKAFGGTMPLTKEDTPQAHSSNRRVELRVLEN